MNVQIVCGLQYCSIGAGIEQPTERTEKIPSCLTLGFWMDRLKLLKKSTFPLKNFNDGPQCEITQTEKFCFV